jgi:hypothetical protein
VIVGVTLGDALAPLSGEGFKVGGFAMEGKVLGVAIWVTGTVGVEGWIEIGLVAEMGTVTGRMAVCTGIVAEKGLPGNDMPAGLPGGRDCFIGGALTVACCMGEEGRHATHDVHARMMVLRACVLRRAQGTPLRRCCAFLHNTAITTHIEL